MQYNITLMAGIAKRQEFTGTTLVVLDTGAAAAIDVDVEISGFSQELLSGIKKGMRMRTSGFTGATFKAAVDCTITIIVSLADISINYVDGANVTAMLSGSTATIPVSNDRGAPSAPVYVSGLTYSDAPATAISDNAAVTVTSTGAALLSANTARKAARFSNIGVDPVAIGTTGMTWAKRCIVLSQGDTWVEERAANLAWSAVTDTGGTASVTVQEVLA
jgi:hypothetical protein